MKQRLFISAIALMLYSVHATAQSVETNAVPSSQQHGTNQVSTADVSYIGVFAFGGVGFGGITSDGEKLFNRIAKRRDALEQFVNLYGLAQGNDEAKMYAMVAFYYLDRRLYNHIKANYKNQKISIDTAYGCSYGSDYLDDLLQRVESGDFDSYVPKPWLKIARHRNIYIAGGNRKTKEDQ